MQKLKLVCKGCGYTWYPDKKKWERNPNANEPDCPNKGCKYFGNGFHACDKMIWEVHELTSQDY